MCLIEKLNKYEDAVLERIETALIKKDFSNGCLMVEVASMKEMRILQDVGRDIRAKVVSRGFNFKTERFSFEVR